MANIPSEKRVKPFVASYVRIAGDLRARIQDAYYLPGQALPGMRQLSADYGAAVGTVQQAVAVLVDEGLLRADGWRGTFVAEHETPSGPSAWDIGRAGASLAGQLRGTVGIIADIGDDSIPSQNAAADIWPLKILNAFERGLAAEPRLATRFVNREAFGSSLDAARSLAESDVDAIAFLAIDDDCDDARLRDVVGNIPIVAAGTMPSGQRVPFAAHDNSAAGRDAAEHLIQAGYRDLIFLAPFAGGAAWQEERLSGAIDGARSAGMGSTLSVVRGARGWKLDDYQPVIGEELAAQVLAERNIAGAAVIAVNDNIAYGFRRRALEDGLAPGGEYGLIGFDDRLPSRELGLTSLSPPLQSIGERAAQILIDALRGDRSVSQIWLRSHLVNRGSSAPLPPRGA